MNPTPITAGVFLAALSLFPVRIANCPVPSETGAPRPAPPVAEPAPTHPDAGEECPFPWRPSTTWPASSAPTASR